MYVFAYLAATAIVALGCALFIAPVRTTRALNEWYLVPPRLRPEQKVAVTAGRLVGLGLVAGGCSLGVSVTYALGRAL
jgi:uncharacterized membrane protein YedE/YeeE